MFKDNKMAYCDYNDVGMMLAFTFDSDTKPTSTKVTEIIAMISSEINMVLKSVGIELPTAGTDFYNLVKLNTMKGSAAVAGITLYSNTEDIEGSQGDYYKKEYNAFLLDLKTNPDRYKETIKESYIGNQVTDGTYTEDEITETFIENDWTP